MKEEEIGVVDNYFNKVGVAAIKITSGTLSIGDKIRFLGNTTDFEQTVESMQIEHQPVEKVSAGDMVGIKTTDRVRKLDKVLKISE
ncbi:MAG: translation elongation factor-like protein [Candidatus Schekmanbacteria bacterium]|nr:MAG: translation elongation factor-like protein [Candidatus Schekmanbacteria bacterium]